MAESIKPTFTFTHQPSTYAAALNSLFIGHPQDTEHDLSQIIGPTFYMIADGETFDRPAFIEHIKWLRGLLGERGQPLQTTHFLRGEGGRRLAERHVAESVHPDGKVWKSETFQQVEVDEDGRLGCILEVVRRWEDEDGPRKGEREQYEEEQRRKEG